MLLFLILFPYSKVGLEELNKRIGLLPLVLEALLEHLNSCPLFQIVSTAARKSVAPIRQEDVPFATGSCGYIHRFAKYVVGLLKAMTLQDTANLLGVTWDTVKDIHTRHLERHYAPPTLEGADCIGIDEFAVRKGHVYKTIVVDLKSGRILYVGEGKGADALNGFWKRVKRKGVDIKYVATASYETTLRHLS